jgi:hypothetical protein
VVGAAVAISDAHDAAARPTEGDDVKTRCFGMMALVVAAAAMVGCGERSGIRPTAQTQTTAEPTPAAAPTVAAVPTVSAMTPPAPEPSRTATPPRQASLGADDALAVKRFVVAHGVKNREPIDPTTMWKGDKNKIYAFVEVENKGGAPSEIVVEFEPPGGGAPHGDVTLSVGAAPRWRTWAYTRTASAAGSWTAVVKNKKGDVLARAPFEVTL